MLVLSRKVGERILIGDQVAVTIVRVTGGGVRLGIEAPADMTVLRAEIVEGEPEGETATQEVSKSPAVLAEQSKDSATRRHSPSTNPAKLSNSRTPLDGKPLRKAR